MKINSKYTLANIVEMTDNEINTQPKEILFDALIINTDFTTSDIGKKSIIDKNNTFLSKTFGLIDLCRPLIKDGGIFYIYGLPNYLSYLAEYLGDRKQDDYYYLFKYWIACEFFPKSNINTLPTAHVGLLMFLKSKSKINPTTFNLNTKYVRIPYTKCPSCGKLTKDWGGKKHLLNPIGSAISDVWSFNHIPIEKSPNIPSELLERILALTSEGNTVALVKQTHCKPKLISNNSALNNQELAPPPDEINSIVKGNCIEYLNDLHKRYTRGIIDLAFADPPYNLSKNYSGYKDDMEDQRYINWCNDWLNGMVNNLKPGGALFVLNIPKWSIFHFNFLAEKMIFQNWIAWDALSTPAGKLLPAHYALLYFIKPGKEPTVNLRDGKIDSREYCLRSSCITNRKKNNDDKKEILTDIWKDIHRIKHKKDRDHHPCQLPTKLMERIIKVFSNEGDLIFDPFGGAGTTAISAKLLSRNFILTELDPIYVEIANNNLNKIKADIFGDLYYIRSSTNKQPSKGISKKVIESSYMNYCFAHARTFTIEELKFVAPEIFELVEQYPDNFQKLIAATRRKMEAHNLLLE